jgi:Pyruvate:ferredoxin oxidoreductase and related 2-oxoacid:ferredoxin oxidoreductases, alpha subunit
VKIGLLRPITLWPFPSKPIKALSEKVKGILCMELNAGQMVEDVKLAVECKIDVEHYGRLGGIVPDPAEVWNAMKKQLNINPCMKSTEVKDSLNTLSAQQIDDAVSNLNTMVP